MFAGDWTPNLAHLFPDREAIIDDRTGRRVTYLELSQRAAIMASALVSLGVGPGDRVAILAKNRLEHFDLMFATARLGALLVPLNWRSAEPELAFLLDDAEPAVLLFDAEFAYVAGRLCATRGVCAVALDPVPAPERSHDSMEQPAQAVVHMEELLAEASSVPPPQAAVDLEDPWIILYTSGTTGRPKGALLPYRQVAFNALNTVVALALTCEDRTITYTPMFHTGAMHVLSTPLLMVGGSFVLTDGFDPDRCLELTERERCSLLFGVPTTFEMMSSAAGFADAELSSVRAALCGGAPCPLSLIDTWASRGVLFKQGYGLTEVGPNCLNLRAEDVARKLGSAGRENLHITAIVVDDQGRTIEGAGTGELLLGGPCVCLGYWRRADATRNALTEDGLFRTGDLVERDAEGFFKIVGRQKDMFISGGENVYPAEVERALTDLDGVRACAVIGVADDRWGEVGRAYLEVTRPISLDEVRRFLKARLASYKVPKELVVVEELPRNASGKVQKHLLTDRPTVGSVPALAAAAAPVHPDPRALPSSSISFAAEQRDAPLVPPLPSIGADVAPPSPQSNP